MSKYTETIETPRTVSSAHTSQHVGDYPFASIARASHARIAWPNILANPQWKWIENVGEFAVYALDDYTDGARTFRVLATGIVQGSVHEIATLLSSSTQDEYFHKMIALHDSEFKRGTHIATVANDSDNETPTASKASANAMANADLSIRSASFAGPSWLHRDEEWCFLDATALDDKRKVFEKLMTSLKIHDILSAGDMRMARLGSGKSLQDAVCAYRVFAEDAATAEITRDGRTPRGAFARVEFFAEYAPPAIYKTRAFPRFGGGSSSTSKQDASLKLTSQRLLSIARNCDRLSLLVRRRRLGVQVLMDKRRVLSLSNRQCISCRKGQRLAKLCRVCGNAVCNDCSQKYERECYRPHTAIVRLEAVRVCDPCMVHIEGGDYDKVTDRSLFGPAVFPDADADQCGAARNTGKNLKALLHDALLTAPSSQRKDAVISVIRALLEQEKDTRPRFLSTLSTATSTTSTEQDFVTALDRLTLTSTSHTDVDVAGQDGRSYTLDPHNLAAHPVPANEPERLRAISDSGVLDKASNWAELDIICDLAAKEVGAFASIVSVITADEQRVVAANNPGFKAMQSSRADAFCAHTIMEDRPLIVPHPEADFRLSHIARRWNMGIRFYCGFPLKAADDSIIGTLCCVDQQTHELTESQYAAMERLAQTATKIIRVEAQKRRPTVA